VTTALPAARRCLARMVAAAHRRRIAPDRPGYDCRMGVLRGLLQAIGGLVMGVVGLLRGLLTGLGQLLRRLF
jgi:hypothetical protein